MSLTEEQVTCKNFQEYHKRILPYLNGSYPTPIVNKFSKGDLYSTEEKIIGQWIDGKPLYQKTINCGTLASGITSVATNISNIDKIIYMNGCRIATDGVSFSSIPNVEPTDNGWSIGMWVENATIKIRSLNYTGHSAYVTLQYTKTTDSPISIGDGNDYSTDEQVVGTWIDGKPIYQKTVDCGTQSGGTTTVEVDHNVSNIGVKFIHEAFILDTANNDSNLLPVVNISASDMIGRIGITNSKITLKQGGGWSNWRAYVTIRYTKTTD